MAAKQVKIIQKKVEVDGEGSRRIKDFYFCQLFIIFSSAKKRNKESSANKDLLLNKNINFRKGTGKEKKNTWEIPKKSHNRRAPARMCKV